MKRRLLRILVGVAIGLALLAGAIWVLTRTLGEREVLYWGKSRYYWIDQTRSSSIAASNQAYQVLNQEIIPGLEKTMFLDTNDSGLRIALVDELNTLPGVNILFRAADSRRADAAMGLGEFGPAARAAVPALLQALQGHDAAVRGSAAFSLGKIHAQPEVIIPLLTKCLDDDDLQESAAEALGEYGPLSKAAIPKLLVLFKVPSKDLHVAVEGALRSIDPDAAALAGVRIEPRPPAVPKAADH
jgi:hypothetical protein